MKTFIFIVHITASLQFAASIDCYCLIPVLTGKE